METSLDFKKEFIKIAVPVALQSLLHSSFSIVDQIMVGQLGEVSIAGIGLAGRFSSIYSVLLSAIASVAGIMLAQYIGKRDDKNIGKSFYLNLILSSLLSLLFFLLCVLIPKNLMGLYTSDLDTKIAAAVYLMIVAIGFFPGTVSIICSTLLRCMGYAKASLYAAIFNAALDTLLSYILIFGKFHFPEMGIAGAAWGTVFAQFAEGAVILYLLVRTKKKEKWNLPFSFRLDIDGWKQYSAILIPILASELFWSFGENVYAAIYGHLGTKPLAAMTLISSMVVLFMGLMGGISSAAGVLCGKRLGAGESDIAYQEAKNMMTYGLFGSMILSFLLILFGRYYVSIFQVELYVQKTAYWLLVVFAIMAPIKVQNMILGGILHSGGKTSYGLIIDLTGTWGFGVPLGFISAFVCCLPITWVYLILSLEECIRLFLAWIIFKSRKWMRLIS